MGIINAEYYADNEFVKKSCKQITFKVRLNTIVKLKNSILNHFSLLITFKCMHFLKLFFPCQILPSVRPSILNTAS
jgi:hypothetical protein